MPKGHDANAKLAGRSDGFRLGSAIPNNDMTAVDEEGTTHFENLISPLIQREMNTSWSWYVQSYAGWLVAVLYVGGVTRIRHDDYQSDNQEDRDDKHQQ